MSATILYNTAKKQVSQIERDLAKLSSATDLTPAEPIIINKLTAAMTTLQKTSNDLTEIARNEITSIQRDKASAWAESIRLDCARLRGQYDEQRKIEQERRDRIDRTTLLQGGASNSFNRRQSNAPDGSSSTVPSSILTMDYMLRERGTIQNSRKAVNDYVDISRNALQDLYEQRELLKGSQRKILNVANSLGLSSTVIKYIEQRTATDNYILFGGLLFTCILMYLIVKYLG